MLSRLPPPFAISGQGGSASSGTVVFSNSNNITFGQNGNTVTASASYSLSSFTVTDPSNSGTVGRLAFTNLNGVTLSLSTGAGGSHTLVGSHNAITSQSSQSAIKGLGVSNTGNTAGNTGLSSGIDWVVAASNNITVSESTAVGGPNTIWISGANVGAAQYSVGVSTGGNTAGNTGVTGTRIVFAGGNNITVSQATDATGATITISGANAGGAQTGISSIAAAGGTQTVGMVSFVNSNGVTFGMSTGANTGTITASVAAQSNQTVGIYGSSQTTGSGSSSTYDARSLTFIGAGIISIGNDSTSAGGTTTGIIISATQSNQAFSAQGGSSAFQTLSFTNSNNVSFSNTNGSVWGSFALNISATGGTSNAISGLTFKDSQGVSFGVSTGAGVATVTASVSQSNQSAIKGLGASNTGNTAGNTGLSSGIDWVIAGTNGITISESTAGGGPNTLWVSGVTTAAQTNQSAIKAFGVSNTGNTAGNTGVSTGIDWVLAASNSLTLSQSTAGGGPDTVWIQVGAYLTTAALSGDTSKYMQNWKLTGNTAGTTSSAQGTDLWFSGGNSITVSGSSNTIVFSVGNYLTTAALSGDTSKYMQAWELEGNNTAGTTSSLQGTKLYLSGGNNITLSGTSNTIVISAPNLGAGAFSGGASNLGNTAGNTGVSGTRGVFVGTNMVSLSQTTDANGFTLSFNATQSSQSAIEGLGVSNTGNTSGNTGISTGIDYVLAATSGGAMTISQSTAAGRATAWFSVPQTSSLSATGIVSISVNGSTISIGAATCNWYGTNSTTQNSSTNLDLRSLTVNATGYGLSIGYSNGSIVLSSPPHISYFYNEIVEQTTFITQTSGSSLFVQPFLMPEPISIGYGRLMVSMNDPGAGTGGTTSANVSFFCDVYSTFGIQVLSQGTGASSRSLTNVTSSSVGMTGRTIYTAGAQGSQYTITLQKSYPVSGTTSSYTTSYAVSSASIVISSNSNTLFTGAHWLDIPFGVSLSPGPYWLAVGLSTQTSTNSSHISFANSAKMQISIVGVSQNTLNPGLMGAGSSASDYQMLKGNGVFTTNANLFSTNGMGVNSISNASNAPVLPFQFIREA